MNGETILMKACANGSPLFPGDVLFKLKDAHGLPLDFALDSIINERGMAVSWADFIEEARRCGWWDFQSYEAIAHAMTDAPLPKDAQEAIKRRLQLYILAHPHPAMQ